MRNSWATCQAKLGRQKRGTSWKWNGLEEILERRRAEGSSLQAEVLQKVPDLVVHERMSQGEKAKGIEEKKELKDGPPRR